VRDQLACGCFVYVLQQTRCVVNWPEFLVINLKLMDAFVYFKCIQVPLVIGHGSLVYGYTPQPAILSELLYILGAEGCAVYVFRRPVMQIFLN
jgi:hypothetical protein